MNSNTFLTFLIVCGLSANAMPEETHKQFRSSIVQKDLLKKELLALVQQAEDKTPADENVNMKEKAYELCLCCMIDPWCCPYCPSELLEKVRSENGQVISGMDTSSAVVAEEPPVVDDKCVCTLNLRGGKPICFPPGCDQPECSCITVLIRGVPKQICVPDGCDQEPSTTKAVIAEEPPVEDDNCRCTLNLRGGKPICFPPGCDQPKCSCITIYIRGVPKKICVPDGCGQESSITKAIVAKQQTDTDCFCITGEDGKKICQPPHCGWQ